MDEDRDDRAAHSESKYRAAHARAGGADDDDDDDDDEPEGRGGGTQARRSAEWGCEEEGFAERRFWSTSSFRPLTRAGEDSDGR